MPKTNAHPQVRKAKGGLALAGGALATLGLPFVLMALRMIGGMFQFILAAGGIAFILGFIGYFKFNRRRHHRTT